MSKSAHKVYPQKRAGSAAGRREHQGPWDQHPGQALTGSGEGASTAEAAHLPPGSPGTERVRP